MGVIKTVLIVAFVIVCILAILLVLVQNDESNGMGSAFGGNSAAFGAHSGSVLKKTTGVLVFLFFVITFGLGEDAAPSDPNGMPGKYFGISTLADYSASVEKLQAALGYIESK